MSRSRGLKELSRVVHPHSIEEMVLLGGGASAGIVLRKLANIYNHKVTNPLGKKLKVSVVERHNSLLWKGEAFGGADEGHKTLVIPDWTGLSEYLLSKGAREEDVLARRVARSLIGDYMEERVEDLLEDPGNLDVSVVTGEVDGLVMDSCKENVLAAEVLQGSDRFEVKGEFFVAATGEYSKRNNLKPGLPQYRFYPFIDGKSEATRNIGADDSLLVLGDGATAVEVISYFKERVRDIIMVSREGVAINGVSMLPEICFVDESLEEIDGEFFLHMPRGGLRRVTSVIDAAGLNVNPKGSWAEDAADLWSGYAGNFASIGSLSLETYLAVLSLGSVTSDAERVAGKIASTAIINDFNKEGASLSIGDRCLGL